MSRHKWTNNKCSVCGITRVQKSERVPDGYGFKKRFYTVYFHPSGKGTLKRPECYNPNEKQLNLW